MNPTPRPSPLDNDPEVEESIGRCSRCGEPLVASDPENPHHRWSGGAEAFLPRICPRCRQSYDPDRPETFEPAGLSQRRPLGGWRPSKTLALGVAAGACLLGGRLAISALTPTSGGGRVADAAAATLAVVFGVYLFLPWVFGTITLCLLALGDRVETLPAKLVVGAGLGLVVCLGLVPAALLAGVILGALAGLVVRWRELTGDA